MFEDIEQQNIRWLEQELNTKCSRSHNGNIGCPCSFDQYVQTVGQLTPSLWSNFVYKNGKLRVHNRYHELELHGTIPVTFPEVLELVQVVSLGDPFFHWDIMDNSLYLKGHD